MEEAHLGSYLQKYELLREANTKGAKKKGKTQANADKKKFNELVQEVAALRTAMVPPQAGGAAAGPTTTSLPPPPGLAAPHTSAPPPAPAPDQPADNASASVLDREKAIEKDYRRLRSLKDSAVLCVATLT